ncbi:MAG: GAF domain-containing protein, partial [Pseudomonadota bacterium]
MPKLILVTGNEPREFELGSFNTIGRHPDNTIQILDRIISKEHAQIVRTTNNRYLLRDLGSLNGTFIREERVKESLLCDGDEINLGSTCLVFRAETPKEQAIDRVTIAAGASESHIRQRIAAETDINFSPEKDIRDDRQLRRDYERLRVAHELARTIGNELDLDRLLQKIVDAAFDLLKADRGAILLMNEEGRPVPRVAKTRSAGATDEIVISNSIINEVIQKKQAVLSSDATIDSRFSGAQSIIMQGIRSTMCVPLIHGDELLGIMHLDSQISTGAFSEKNLQVFTGIAAQAAMAIQNARLAHTIQEEAHARAQFERFFSPGMVDLMVDGRLKLDGVGEMREVTILFADIRGFTSMTENADARDIVNLLNDYFEVMVDVLFRYEGTLDKYVGDEIMALFGVPLAQENAAELAVECAIEMQHALE